MMEGKKVGWWRGRGWDGGGEEGGMVERRRGWR